MPHAPGRADPALLEGVPLGHADHRRVVNIGLPDDPIRASIALDDRGPDRHSIKPACAVIE